MSTRALVIGGGIEGIQAALDLADSGMEITLVEESPALHADLLGGSHLGRHGEALLFMPKLLKAASHPNIDIITNANVTRVKGEKGDFGVTIIKHPRYTNVDICTSCGRCERECPVEIIPLSGDAQDGYKAIHRPDFGLKAVPSAYIIEKKGTPPCNAACPAGINVQGYVALVSKGKFTEALDLITEAVPFPRVLGRVCTHPCEGECTRSKIDQAVSICALKRLVADNSSTESSLRRTQASNNDLKPNGHPKVAIIGAGAAGLTAARDLARLGHRSTVFEALPIAGGMISVGMPRFRLPREIRQADIDAIVRLGIEIRTSTPIGPELTLHDLKRQGYEAILMATGAHKNQRLGIPGENLSGVINSITFLQALNLKQPIKIGYKVVVVGGGYTAIDSARTAIRLHCERVLILYRRSLEEIPANPEEVAEAQEEGVEIEYLAAPVRIVGQQGKVIGVECIRMRLGEPDKSGRRRPIPIEGSEFFVEADTVIVAVGQRPDLSFLNGDTTLTEGRRHIFVDPLTMATKTPGIFAAGDVASESGPLINAIADGRQAAVSIDRFLRGEDLKQGRSRRKVASVKVNLDEINVPPIERQPMPCLRHEYRVGNFEEVELGFTAQTAVKEAKRCLNCAGCSECLECERACELNAIDHNLRPQRLDLEVDTIITAKNTGTWQTAARPGIYLIAATSPNGDLSQASAVATKVMVDMAKHHRASRDGHKIRQETSQADTPEQTYRTWNSQAHSKLEPRVGVFVCSCGGSISEVVDVPNVVEYCRGLNGIIYSGEIGYACTNEAAEEIKGVARQHNLTHVVLAACSCCNLDQICFSCSDRRLHCKSNLLDGSQSGISYEFVNIREHCAWVHYSQPEKATTKAKSLIRAGIAHAKDSQPLAKKTLSIERSVLVVDGGPSGMQAATDLAAQGFQTTLITHDGQSTSQQSHPTWQRLERDLASNGATVLSGAKLTNVNGTAGKYQATVVQNGKSLTLTVGAIILDWSAERNAEKNGSEESSPLPEANKTALPPLLLSAIRNKSGPLGTIQEPAVSRLPGVFLCSTEEALDVADALVRGSAAASKASAWLSKGTIDTEQTVVAVDQHRCRGCGTCAATCPFVAIKLVETKSNIFIAQVDEGLCRGCGICVAQCPSGALSQSDYSDHQITASLEAVLS